MKFKNVDADHTQHVAHELYACTVVSRGVNPCNTVGGYQFCKCGGSLLPCLQGQKSNLM